VGGGAIEYRFRHFDGHYVWILSRGRPVEWDKSGNPIRTVGTDQIVMMRLLGASRWQTASCPG